MRCIKTGHADFIVGCVVAERRVEWRKSGTESTPESTEREEDDHGEGVADDELSVILEFAFREYENRVSTYLASSADSHEHSTEEEVGTNAGRSVTGLGASEVHQIACEGSERQEEANKRTTKVSQ